LATTGALLFAAARGGCIARPADAGLSPGLLFVVADGEISPVLAEWFCGAVGWLS
jgi:hypothetical protein